MDNRKERVEDKENFDLSTGKDSLSKSGRKKKSRREMDTLRKITKECMKDWRSVDFDEDIAKI